MANRMGVVDHNTSDMVEHLQSHAGKTLQAVVVYDGDRHRDLYRREDLSDLHGSELEREVLEDIRSDRQRWNGAGSDQYEGEHRATVRVFDARVVLHLPRDDESGTVIVLDPAAARNLATFVDDIRQDIYND